MTFNVPFCKYSFVYSLSGGTIPNGYGVQVMLGTLKDQVVFTRSVLQLAELGLHMPLSNPISRPTYRAANFSSMCSTLNPVCSASGAVFPFRRA